MSALTERLVGAVAGSPLAERVASPAAALAETRGAEAAADRLSDGVAAGLARVLASEPRVAGFLAQRPGLLERLAEAGTASLEKRLEALQSQSSTPDPDVPLEEALDGLRLLRREETAFAAVLDLGGCADFDSVSVFLSVLAETIARRALALAQAGLHDADEPALSILGMGKLAGREFTYHSDLDLVFVYPGGVEAIDTASRVAQRFIAYITTMTGAGVAYAVDTRLRPSGRQGALVTSMAGFERYQTEQAETWEHLALLRARVVAGDLQGGGAVLQRVRDHVFAAPNPAWEYLDDLRRRVERERADESDGQIPLKTGAGGLMDIDFLAGGALLERGAADYPALPSVEAMLRTAGAAGPAVDALIDDYRFLRRVEARARWCSGRPVEALDADDALRALVAETLEPGLSAAELVERLAQTRTRVRATYDAVVRAGSIAALSDT